MTDTVPPAKGSLFISNVRLPDGSATELNIENGRIASPGAAPPAGTPRLDGDGRLALPGLVDAHTHLDKTLLGMGWYRNQVGPLLLDKIENERAERRRLGIEPRRQSARQARLAATHGTVHIRSHVDVDTETGTAGIEGVLATREVLRDVIGIELVAFPQSGLLVRPGTLALMEQALRLGAETVGGLDPCAIDRDPKGHLDAVFGLAERFGRGVDIHLHEPGEMGAFSTELIVERTRALGMQGRVMISHAFCLGMADEVAVGQLIEALAQARIGILTTGPAARPAPPIKRLLAAGVTVCAGNDGIRDTWGPYGNADMLERAMLLGLRNNFRRDDELALALDACTIGGAGALGLQDYGLAPGCTADLVLVAADTVAEAIVSRPSRRTVIRRGRVIVRDGEPLFPAGAPGE